MKPYRLTKENLLQDAPVRLENASIHPVYEANGTSAGLYTHEVPEISVVISGTGIHRILNQAIPCGTGDIYITRPDVPHGFFTEPGGSLTVRRLWFDPVILLPGDTAEPDHPSYCCGVFSDSALTACAKLTARTQDQILEQTDAILRELLEKRDQWHRSMGAHLTLLLVTVARYVGSAIKTNSASRTREWGVVSEAIRRVMEDYSSADLTLGTIADAMCVSKSHLSRLFMRITGEAFSDYLRNFRLEQACRLLKETDLSVERIVRQCGLRDIPSFYRSFQARMGITPNRYRAGAAQEHKGGTIMVILSEISEQLQNGKWKQVKALVQQALDEGAPADKILNEGLLAGMSVIGELFKNDEVYIPEVLVAARAMNAGVQVLKPYLASSGVQSTGRVCIGTVQGDLHDIGKNLVKMMMEGKGLEVIDLGTDVTPETFVKTAIEQECQVICCSALLTTTMGVIEDVVKAAEAAGIRDKVKIMIGGAPVNEAYCRKICADVYTSDAASAADAAVALCRE